MRNTTCRFYKKIDWLHTCGSFRRLFETTPQPANQWQKGHHFSIISNRIMPLQMDMWVCKGHSRNRSWCQLIRRKHRVSHRVFLMIPWNTFANGWSDVSIRFIFRVTLPPRLTFLIVNVGFFICISTARIHVHWNNVSHLFLLLFQGGRHQGWFQYREGLRCILGGAGFLTVWRERWCAQEPRQGSRWGVRIAISSLCTVYRCYTQRIMTSLDCL